MKLNKHMLIMLVGCGLPLLLLFFAPALGLSSGMALFIFIILMFACHLLMPMHGGHGAHEGHDQSKKESECLIVRPVLLQMNAYRLLSTIDCTRYNDSPLKIFQLS